MQQDTCQCAGLFCSLLRCTAVFGQKPGRYMQCRNRYLGRSSASISLTAFELRSRCHEPDRCMPSFSLTPCRRAGCQALSDGDVLPTCPSRGVEPAEAAAQCLVSPFRAGRFHAGRGSCRRPTALAEDRRHRRQRPIRDRNLAAGAWPGFTWRSRRKRCARAQHGKPSGPRGTSVAGAWLSGRAWPNDRCYAKN